MSRLLERGYRVFMVTATVSHHLGDHLGDVFGLVRDGWSSLWRGGPAHRWRERFGYVGAVSSVEVTYGANGRHPHNHSLLVFAPESPVTLGDVQRLGDRFAAAVGTQGGYCDARGAGWHVSPVVGAEAVAQYLTKVQESDGWSAGLELARGDLKAARSGGLKPFDLLELASMGCLQSAALWRVYETVTVGRRMIRWSPGLKALAGVDESSDDDLAVSAPDDVIVAEWFVPAVEWDAWVRSGRLAHVLEFFEDAAPPDG